MKIELDLFEIRSLIEMLDKGLEYLRVNVEIDKLNKRVKKLEKKEVKK